MHSDKRLIKIPTTKEARSTDEKLWNKEKLGRLNLRAIVEDKHHVAKPFKTENNISIATKRQAISSFSAWHLVIIIIIIIVVVVKFNIIIIE